MKKIIFISSLFVLITFGSFGQKISLNGFGGYTFSDNFTLSGYSVDLKDNWHYGGGIEFMVRPLYGVEILYQYQNMDATLYDYYLNNYTTNLSMSYIMLGGMRYIPFFNGNIQPYGGINVGVAVLDAGNVNQTSFAWGAKLGLKLKASNRIAFRLQAQMYSVVDGVSSSIWFAPGASGVSFNSYSSVYQFGLTAGISIGF